MKNPRTKSEWQEAVDLAHIHLLLDSARKYGLVKGGPQINIARCEEILDAGRAKGFSPRPDAVKRWAKAISG